MTVPEVLQINKRGGIFLAMLRHTYIPKANLRDVLPNLLLKTHQGLWPYCQELNLDNLFMISASETHLAAYNFLE